MITAKKPPESCAGTLIGLLEEQLVGYRQLQELVERQRELICGDDSQALLSLLSERQQVVEHLNQISGRLGPLQGYWREHHEFLEPEQRRRAEDLLSRTGETLRRILSSDEQDSRLLAARKTQMGRAVQQAAEGQQVCRAYQVQRENPREHFIRTDESA